MKFRYGFLLVVSVLLCMSAAWAMPVYVFSSGSSTFDNAVMNALAAAGNTPVLGPLPSAFDGTQADLKTFHVVVLVDNWGNATNGIPFAGQVALLNFIYQGGGLVTGEWVVWGATERDDYDEALAVAIPATSADWFSGSSTTYTQTTADSILNNGLPSSFMFSLNDLYGSEAVLSPKAPAGAVTYYMSSQTSSAGVIGWEFGSGRVISFSTLLTSVELGSTQYTKLFTNAVQWAAPSAPFTITMTKPVYSGSDVVTISQWRLANTRANPINVELKIWLQVPGIGPLALINIGSDGSFQLPATVDLPIISAPLALFPVAGLPKGDYQLGGRAIEPSSGRPLSLNVASFTVQ